MVEKLEEDTRLEVMFPYKVRALLVVCTQYYEVPESLGG
jgi:hypothetical protein